MPIRHRLPSLPPRVPLDRPTHNDWILPLPFCFFSLILFPLTTIPFSFILLNITSLSFISPALHTTYSRSIRLAHSPLCLRAPDYFNPYDRGPSSVFTVSTAPMPCIDHTAFPHIIDSILGFDGFVPMRDLTPHRLLCRDIRDRVDAIHLKHIVVRPASHKSVLWEASSGSTSGGCFFAPSLFALQPYTLDDTTQRLSRRNAALKRIEMHTRLVDIVSFAMDLINVSHVKVPIVRFQDPRGRTYFCVTIPAGRVTFW